jgi:hypothetical protein
MSPKIKYLSISLILIFIVYVIFSVYNTSKEGMGSFNDFDPNSTANKNIKVEILHEKGTTNNSEGCITFFVKDKN